MYKTTINALCSSYSVGVYESLNPHVLYFGLSILVASFSRLLVYDFLHLLSVPSVLKWIVQRLNVPLLLVFEGSLVLIGGDPGVGKSTLVLQVMRNFEAAI
jgi:hypothetical protein